MDQIRKYVSHSRIYFIKYCVTQAVEDKPVQYQIIRSNNPEKERCQGLGKKRTLTALAGVVGLVAGVILAVCFFIVANIYTGGMGAGLLPGAVYVMGVSKEMSI